MPTKENLADRNVTTTELAAVLGITGRRVQQLTQDGVLVTASRGKFVLSDAVQAYIGSISRGGLTKEEAEEAKKIERVKAKAEATLKTSKAKIAQAEAKELSGQIEPIRELLPCAVIGTVVTPQITMVKKPVGSVHLVRLVQLIR